MNVRNFFALKLTLWLYLKISVMTASGLQNRVATLSKERGHHSRHDASLTPGLFPSLVLNCKCCGKIVSLACRWLLCPLQGTSWLFNTLNETEGPEHGGGGWGCIASLACSRRHDPNLFLTGGSGKGALAVCQTVSQGRYGATERCTAADKLGC